MMNCKKQNQKIHFKKRCLERLGRELTREEYDRIKKAIRNSDRSVARFLYKTSTRATCYHVNIDEKEFELVYDKNRSELVTLYPYRECLTGQELAEIGDRENLYLLTCGNGWEPRGLFTA